jgi:hypothetical protein
VVFAEFFFLAKDKQEGFIMGDALGRIYALLFHLSILLKQWSFKYMKLYCNKNAKCQGK